MTTEKAAISPEEFRDWQAHKVTQAIRAAMRKRVEMFKERWVAEGFRSPEANSKAIAEVQTLITFIDYSYESLKVDLSNDDQ